MNRGYFADTKEFKEHGGKITAANKTVIHAVSAVKFPELAVTLSSGKVLKLPVTSGSSEVNAESLVVPKVSLVCLSFRASSQMDPIQCKVASHLEKIKILDYFQVHDMVRQTPGLAPCDT
ncbi:hypothetical protein F2Q69_00059829 [Brassica cretica]|uniref:Uncharacterized protein n=1 Tax=Brassica cretica TaxID=69181 RepID=A0A8S9RQ50_BRACR|nr:hypothetical protein F2Q69_00059829 [Brassica cretica]